jgi:hypothetical protein
MKAKRTRGKTIFDEAGIAHLRFLAAERLSAPEIAEALGSTRGSVYTMCSRYRIPLGDDNVEHIKLLPRIMELIAAEAKRRDISRNKLIARIAAVVAKDDLFDAVLGTPADTPSAGRHAE